MNIEIANRLQKLRKEKGYSQEELADKLGISRQAVSKWERAEASPDTDNLICLAKLYGVSLDVLLNTDESVEDIAKEKQEETDNEETKDTKKKDRVNISKDGIHVVSEDGDEVHIDTSGIHINDKDVEIVDSGEKKTKESWKFETCSKKKRYKQIAPIVGGIYTVSVIIAYIILGLFLKRGWSTAWVLFITIPIPSDIIHAIGKRRFCSGTIVFLATALYLFLGTMWGLWHPYWFIFLFIPLYYTIFGPIDSHIRHKRNEKFFSYCFNDNKKEEKN